MHYKEVFNFYPSGDEVFPGIVIERVEFFLPDERSATIDWMLGPARGHQNGKRYERDQLHVWLCFEHWQLGDQWVCLNIDFLCRALFDFNFYRMSFAWDMRWYSWKVTVDIVIARVVIGLRKKEEKWDHSSNPNWIFPNVGRLEWLKIK